MRTVAVVLAAGSGQRFGGLPKQLRTLAGRTLIEHSVAAFDTAPGVDAILVVTSAGLTGRVRALLADGGYRKVSGVIEGGLTRTDSTRRAIAALDGDECDVLFHDAARPLIDQPIIAACVRALATDRAVGVTVPSSDTIVEAVDGVVTRIGRDRRLRRRAALPAAGPDPRRARQRAQHQDHLSGRPGRRRAAAQALTRLAGGAGAVRNQARRAGEEPRPPAHVHDSEHRREPQGHRG